MSQKTDLNVSPYFDDFDSNKNYYRVLFKPGFPVQSRELTTLQSILQNQIESFGSHFFKEGSIVIPGNITYDPNYYAVKINDSHLGLDVGIYLKNLIGKRIQGQNSQITASVINVLTKKESKANTYTLYVKYLNSDSNFNINTFTDGETLITLDTFKYGNTSINSGQTVASLIASNATATGSAVSISKGVYFIRGTFVNINESTLILDQYTNKPSYRVGLSIQESLEFASSENKDLFDNARGFSNYSAPGADRLKISTSLTAKSLNDFDDTNFVEILRVSNGVVKKLQDSNTYSLIKEYIAKRTYEESGDYALSPFDVEVKNSLNDQISSNGIYFENQKTDQNNTPSENLLSLKISPGKAYVRGFDVEKVETTILDVEKPRDTNTVVTSSIPFEMGNLIRINNVSGTPVIGIDNNHTVSLRDQRKNSNTAANGNEIGKARVYSFNLSNSAYSNNASSWDLYLFDVQTYTTLTLNQSLTSIQCPISSYIEGISSGASGYVAISPTNQNLTLTQTSGIFSPGEQIKINGKTELSRSINLVRSYATSDIKSIYQNSSSIGLSTDFVADTVLTSKTLPNFKSGDILSVTASGIASCAGRTFVGVASDTIIRYQRPGFGTETFNRISSVSSNGLTITLSGVSTVNGVCDGAVALSTSTTFSVGSPSFLNEENAFLYAKLNNKNISDVSFTSSEIRVTRQTSGKSTNNVGTLSLSLSDVGISSAYFDSFNVGRYSVFYSDGTVDPLTSDKFTLDGTATSITLTGLTPNKSNIIINSTVKKNSIKNKQKLYLRSQKLAVDKTASGVSTAISGLTTSNFYGLRIEDDQISLNVPDVVKVIAVYESVNNASPSLDALNFQTGSSLDTNSILGEKIVGETSGAVGQIVTKSSSTKIEFVYLNSNKFINGETVTFKESNISSAIQSIDVGSYVNRTQEYVLDKGQREQYCDYSRIVRKNSSVLLTKQLLVIYDCYSVPSSDNGDVYSVNSYDSERYEKDIPTLKNNTRASDILDFRPRVAPYVVGVSTVSPFDFNSRTFSSSGNNPTLVVTPNESSTVGYSYYLPRIDKIVLNKNGLFTLLKGTSAANPKEPSIIDDSMSIAVIKLPAYLYNPEDAEIVLTNNKRYTMRDIGSLEQRIENLEIATSLSLLELKTQSLQVLDSDGVNKFKSGFFVDDFKTNNFIDLENNDAKCIINKQTEELNADISSYSLKSELGISGDLNISTADFSTNLALFDSNVRKTGDLITLNYNEVSAGIGQTYATAEQNINPAGLSNYNGYVKLTPSSDTWVRSINSENGVVIRTQGEWNNSFVNNLLLSTNPSTKFKSKNIQFYATGLQPNTQYYSFFDGNSNIDVIPKLLKISMTSGSAAFQSGETVDGYLNGVKIASFRLATANHKKGTYNATTPTVTYAENPYSTSTTLATYTTSSSVLNIDTYSLSDDASAFFGYLPTNAVLIGKTSGAQATVSTQTLITDSVGDLIGCFFIRDPFQTPAPSSTYTVGSKTFKLSSSSSNSSSTGVSFTQNTFYATGIVNSQTYTQSVSIRRSSLSLPLNALRTDPLSQTFRTDNEGMFLSSVDLYFADKDITQKIFVEVRETDIGGVPKTNLVQDYARAEILPAGITTSVTGQTPTNVKFDSPVYLEPNKQYALCLLTSSSSNYKVWTAQTNQATVSTQNLPNAQQVIYSNNYIGGNLYKPQNGSIWNSSTSEDLTFKLYKCNFSSTSGTAYFHNPNVSIGSTTYINDKNIPKLVNNPIKTLPRKLNVGITSSLISVVGDILVPGRKILEGNAYGYIENVGGTLVAITTSNVGTGYSNGTFSNVSLYNITGSGVGAAATVVISNNQISSIIVSSGGYGYVSGDVLGVTTSSVVKGSGARLTVTSPESIDTLYLTNVQGEEFSLSQPISYYNGTTNVSMASTLVTRASTVPSDLYTGNVFEVSHYNHSMQSSDNKIVIADVFPNTTPEAITASITSQSTTISIGNTANFTSFEGVSVSASNPGYVIINNEIISYTSVGSGSLTIGQRGKFESPTRTHSVGDLVYKYELNGVSLARINKSHVLSTNQTLKENRGIDSYHIQFDRLIFNDRSGGDFQLSFTDQRNIGGSNAKASQNIQFSSIIPQFNVVTPENTNVSALIRTISGTSVNGTESSFIDQGYAPVTLNEVNNFNTPRIIASRVNETNILTSSAFSNNKSLTLGISLNTTNSNLSPVIDTSESATFVMNRNRVNKPIKNYTSDNRSNLLTGDPHSSVYISKRINLQQPATSLKLLLTSYRHSSSDFRVLYRLFKTDSSEVDQSYQLFPGYNNLTDNDGNGFGETVIDVALNDGLPDSFVRSSNTDEFLQYQFTANNLEEFTGFVIKIVMSGTNEAYAPKFKDLRAIALA